MIELIAPPLYLLINIMNDIGSGTQFAALRYTFPSMPNDVLVLW